MGRTPQRTVPRFFILQRRKIIHERSDATVPKKMFVRGHRTSLCKCSRNFEVELKPGSRSPIAHVQKIRSLSTVSVKRRIAVGSLHRPRRSPHYLITTARAHELRVAV